jgi:ubiquinone/menaquinone biosynthesis C-methylase UbiE
MGRVLEPEVMESAEVAAAYDELDRLFGDILFQGFAESAVGMGVTAGRVLDVGTGPGRIAIRIARLNPALALDAIDLSRSMLDLAAANAARQGVASRIRFSVGDAKSIPFPDQTFDLVVCHNMLHQLPDPLVTVREINRVAKPEGAILVRDVRRLHPLLMETLLPLYCLRYSRTLRKLTYDSYRAGLDYREFADMVRQAGIERAQITTQLMSHISVGRPAIPYRELSGGVASTGSFVIRALRAPYVGRPQS